MEAPKDALEKCGAGLLAAVATSAARLVDWTLPAKISQKEPDTQALRMHAAEQGEASAGEKATFG